MNITVCEKCRGPIVVEDGKYVCVLCNTTYGDAEASEKVELSKDFCHFYENTSIAKLQEINNFFCNRVILSKTGAGNKTRSFLPVIFFSSISRTVLRIELSAETGNE